jgi:hypothetical protein
MSTANATTTPQLPPVVFPELVPATPLHGGSRSHVQGWLRRREGTSHDHH